MSLLTLYLSMRLAGDGPGTLEPFEPFIAQMAGKGKQQVRRTHYEGGTTPLRTPSRIAVSVPGYALFINPFVIFEELTALMLESQ